MNDRIKVEPTAEMRQAAITCYQWYIALVDQGFSESQALAIVGAMIGGQR